MSMQDPLSPELLKGSLRQRDKCSILRALSLNKCWLSFREVAENWAQWDFVCGILLLLNSNNVYLYINNNHKNKKVITLVGNSSIKLLLFLQKGLINNRLTTICCPLIHVK